MQHKAWSCGDADILSTGKHKVEARRVGRAGTADETMEGLDYLCAKPREKHDKTLFHRHVSGPKWQGVFEGVVYIVVEWQRAHRGACPETSMKNQKHSRVGTSASNLAETQLIGLLGTKSCECRELRTFRLSALCDASGLAARMQGPAGGRGVDEWGCCNSAGGQAREDRRDP